MTKILHIDSSAKSENSVTRALTAAAVQQLQSRHPGSPVVYRDLTKNPLPHISPEFLGGVFGNPDLANHQTVVLSDLLIAEVFDADVIVIGAPMYNFSIPSQLKAWIDFILRAGKTFKYTESGPVGFVKDKKVIIAVGSGGVYSEGPMASFDHVVPYLKQALGFIGITDVTVVRAEKQALGAEVALVSLEGAKKDIERQVGAI